MDLGMVCLLRHLCLQWKISLADRHCAMSKGVVSRRWFGNSSEMHQGTISKRKVPVGLLEKNVQGRFLYFPKARLTYRWKNPEKMQEKIILQASRYPF